MASPTSGMANHNCSMNKATEYAVVTGPGSQLSPSSSDHNSAPVVAHPAIAVPSAAKEWKSASPPSDISDQARPASSLRMSPIGSLKGDPGPA